MRKSIKATLVAAVALLSSIAANAQYSFTMNDLEGNVGSTIELPISMNNTGLDVTSFNFDLILPEGISVAVDEYGDIDAELSSRSQRHILATTIIEGGARYVAYSSQNRAFRGTEGEILTTKLVLNTQPGEYTIQIKNARITKAETFEEFVCEDTSAKLVVKDNTTGIVPVVSTTTTNDVVYDLNGTRSNNPRNAIVIKSGKKLLVR